ncbi:MAG: hypothetical protein ACLQU3_09055 [Limisphaerales bacterium]
MTDKELLYYRRLPARLSIEQTALLLGFMVYEVNILVRLGLLRCLGAPAPNSHKYLSAAEIESLAKDRNFLEKASRAVAKHVREHNRKAQNNTRELAA